MKKLMKMITSAVAALLVFLNLPGITLTVHAQTLGERMADAAYVVVLGMGTVFVMLIIIALIIYAFKVIPKIQKLFSGKNKSENVSRDTALAGEMENGQVESIVDAEDELELVAVIAATIAAYEQVPVDSFRVRTIKRRK